MSKESLDYSILCSNYYSSYENGTCMESCEFYNHNECPIVYINGLLEERDKKIADLEAKLAESEKKYSYMKDLYYAEREKADNFCNLLNKEIAMFLNVEHQLAEKDKQILELQEQSIRDNQLYNEELAEKDKQVRKEVVKQITNELKQKGRWDMKENGSIYFKMNIYTLNDILDKADQIQGDGND